MQPSDRATVLPGAVRSGIPVACLMAVAAAFFVPVLNGYWLADDFGFVREFHQYPWSDTFRLFLGDWSRHRLQEYRPLFAVSFLMDLSLWGPNPLALHVTNLGLHLVVCGLVWRLAATVPGAGKFAPTLALAFFALSPIHTEPVAWISARGHILASIFVLGALILMRRFERHGGKLSYVASLVCAAAAFATQEIAVALPPLLLANHIVDAPRRDRPWLRRMIVTHAPFWVLLASYLGFRYLIFDVVGRPTLSGSIPTLIRDEYLAFRALFLGQIGVGWLPVASLGRPARVMIKAALYLLTPVLLLTPLVSRTQHGRRGYARGLILFAVLWPLISTAMLFGAHSPRHLYLASIGVAIALGLAGSHLLMGRRFARGAGIAIICLLCGVSGVGLSSYIALYARNGRLSRDLAREIDSAIEHAASDRPAVIAISPDFPQRQASFWDYFYPLALGPPFRNSPPPPNTLPSFASCRCKPAEWKAENSETLVLLNNRATVIHLVLWDEGKAAFVTRVLSQPAFWRAGYASPNGLLVRAHQPGLAEPALPFFGPSISRGGLRRAGPEP
jgi:hypothetical protein